MSARQRLIVTSGLPGSGKSTIAEGLAKALPAAILSVDPIEAAMWRSGLAPAKTGIAAYRVAETLASENLSQGLSVIVDAVNPVDEARAIWRELSEQYAIGLKVIEVICSDETIHRQRIETRVRNIEGMPETSWDRVIQRKAEFVPWTDDRLVLDSATESVDALIEAAIQYCLGPPGQTATGTRC
jgi:predicted kinase